MAKTYRRGIVGFLSFELHCSSGSANGLHIVAHNQLTPSNSIVELIKHRVYLIAGGIVRSYERTVVRDNHRDIGELSLAELNISVAGPSVSRPGSSGGGC